MKFKYLAVVAFVLLAACSSITVKTDWDHHADFTKFKTFAWFDHTGAEHQPRQPNQIVDTRIRRAIAEDLIAKGMSQTSPAKADIHITYYTSTESHLQMYSSGWGYGYWGGWHMGYTDVYQYEVGTMIVDVIDRGDRQLVWRGTLSKALSQKDSSEKRIRNAVAKLLYDFPPGS